MTVEIRRGTARFVDREPGRVTRHAFSFGSHYDPERLALGPMVCHDDHLLGAGRGFETHRHSDLLIVSYVVEGALVHGGSGVREAAEVRLEAGSVAVLSAGAEGVEHAEHAASSGPCRFVQTWLRPGEESDVLVQPGEYQHAVPDTVPDSAHPIAQPRLDAVLWRLRLSGDPSLAVELPTAPLVHAFVATGSLLRSSLAEPLATGDAFVLTGERAVRVAAGVPTDLLVWTFHDGPAPVLTGTGTAGWFSTEPPPGHDRPITDPEAADREVDEQPPVGRLRLMGDYGGMFLWDEEGGIGGDGDGDYLHRHLGIDRELYDDLVSWGHDWDGADGTASHNEQGRRLLERLRAACPDREIDLVL